MSTMGDEHARRLRRMRAPESRRKFGTAIYLGANELKVEAGLLITEGAVSGAGHVASKPGEAPNEDTGFLRGNIEAVRTGELTAETESRAPYGLRLELGDETMEERPYMRPATALVRPRIVRRVQLVLQDIIRGIGGFNG